jgi:hypothetical protein
MVGSSSSSSSNGHSSLLSISGSSGGTSADNTPGVASPRARPIGLARAPSVKVYGRLPCQALAVLKAQMPPNRLNGVYQALCRAQTREQLPH